MKQIYKTILGLVDERTQDINSRHKNSRVLIVDGTNNFIRCWSSVPTMNDDGDHVAGITTVLKSIGYAIKQTNPTRVIVIFDGKGGASSRRKIYSGYKSKRSTNKLRVNRQYDGMMNDEDERESMKRQYKWLSDVLDVLPVTTMIYDGVEADDVMGYIATQLIKEDEQAVIMSTDKDFLQLVSDSIIVWSPTKKKIYNRETVKEEFGIDANNILLYRTLDGDTSDEIPGVKGIGLKTLVKRLPELADSTQLSINDLFRLCEEKQTPKKPIKIYTDILNARPQLELNEKLMQLYSPNISGTIKMDILSTYDEPTKPLNKLDFMKVCMKYKIIDTFGNMSSWLNATYGTLITEKIT